MILIRKNHYISHYSDGTNNNFNLIRFFCAWGVLVYHSSTLAEKTLSFNDPFFLFFRASMGEILVMIFFSISGFLIYRSICRSSSLLSYVIARVLRLLPALVVILSVSILVLGPLVSDLPTYSYFTHPGTWSYFYNLNLFDMATHYTLPGSFSDNPYKGSVNGSLWTLPIEVRMYVVTAVLFYGALLVFKLLPRLDRKVTQALFVILSFFAAFLITEHYLVIGNRHELSIFVFCCAFLIGSVMYAYREVIPLKLSLCLILLFGIHFLQSSHIYPLYLSLTITYVTLFVAYIPKGWILNFNKLGDYSYGMYIFAFPVQQSLSYWTDVGFLGMVFWATLITLFFSVLSWHFIEKPMLGKKAIILNFCSGVTAKILKCLYFLLNTFRNTTSIK